MRTMVTKRQIQKQRRFFIAAARGEILKCLDGYYPCGISKNDLLAQMGAHFPDDMNMDRELAYLSEAGFIRCENWKNPVTEEITQKWEATCQGIDLVEGTLHTERGIAIT